MRIADLEIHIPVTKEWIPWDPSKPLPKFGVWREAGELGEWTLIETERSYRGEVRIRAQFRIKNVGQRSKSENDLQAFPSQDNQK